MSAVTSISDRVDLISAGSSSKLNLLLLGAVSSVSFSFLAMKFTVVPCTTSETIVMKNTMLKISDAFSIPAVSG